MRVQVSLSAPFFLSFFKRFFYFYSNIYAKILVILIQRATMSLQEQLQKTKESKKMLATLPHQTRISFLYDCADLLLEAQNVIIDANQKDLNAAKELDLSNAMMERLELNPKKILNMAESLRQIADFPDPLNRILGGFTNHCGLRIQR